MDITNENHKEKIVEHIPSEKKAPKSVYAKSKPSKSVRMKISKQPPAEAIPISKLKEKQEEKAIKLDRENEQLIENFKKMCQEKNLRAAKLTKGKFKAFLSQRYKGQVADKIT